MLKVNTVPLKQALYVIVHVPLYHAYVHVSVHVYTIFSSCEHSPIVVNFPCKAQAKVVCISLQCVEAVLNILVDALLNFIAKVVYLVLTSRSLRVHG